MISDIEDFFSKGCGRCERFDTPDCSTRRWIDGLNALRRICRGAGLQETVKWGHPCYMHEGRNIAIVGAFRSGFRLTFFNAALMTDPDSLLERQGPNSRHKDMLNFTDSARVSEIEPIILSYLKEGMAYAESGAKPARIEYSLDLPEELIDALDDDPELSEAFHGLTPGRQKSYVINLAGAKTADTRIARIAKFRGKIIEGKGALDR
jgi:uncharacterized protein YdeI (YjbR/CyaY-like superfamily)